jgi:hypothetical protein
VWAEEGYLLAAMASSTDGRAGPADAAKGGAAVSAIGQGGGSSRQARHEAVPSSCDNAVNRFSIEWT